MRACSFKYHQELIIDGWPTTRASVIAHDTIGRVWFPGPQGGTKYGPHHRHHGRAPPQWGARDTITYACALLRAAGRVGGSHLDRAAAVELLERGYRADDRVLAL